MKHTQFVTHSATNPDLQGNYKIVDGVAIEDYKQEITASCYTTPLKPCKKPFKNLFFIWYLIWVVSSIILIAEAIVLGIQPDVLFPLWAILTASCLLGGLITKLLTRYL